MCVWGGAGGESGGGGGGWRHCKLRRLGMGVGLAALHVSWVVVVVVV